MNHVIDVTALYTAGIILYGTALLAVIGVSWSVAQWLWPTYGEHRPKPWRRSVAELKEAIRPPSSGEPILLGTYLQDMKWYGIVSDLSNTPDMMTATLTLAPESEMAHGAFCTCIWGYDPNCPAGGHAQGVPALPTKDGGLSQVKPDGNI